MSARRALPHIPVLLLAFALLSGCRADPSAAPLAVENGWLRPPLLMQRPGAGYLDLVNRSNNRQVIVGASITAPAGASVEIHETIDRGGRILMRRLERLTIEPGETVALAPGGKHLMVFGITPETTYIELAFELADGSALRAALSAPPGSP